MEHIIGPGCTVSTKLRLFLVCVKIVSPTAQINNTSFIFYPTSQGQSTTSKV